jgi:putative drug exporter of the RND superfamily
MFTALARSVVAHPWRTIVVWLILAGVAIGLSASLSSVTTSNQQTFLPKSFESVGRHREPGRLPPGRRPTDPG